MATLLFYDGIMSGNDSWASDDFKVILVDDTYTTYFSDTYLDDIPSGAIWGAAVSLTNKATSTSGGENIFIADQNVDFGVITAGHSITQMILYRDTGDPSTSYLVERWSSSEISEFPYSTTGVNVDLDFPEHVPVAGRGRVMVVGS